ncbi:MAG: hypothetical protein ACI35R_10590 [Bacillus sp. (in: firmicutes)]
MEEITMAEKLNEHDKKLEVVDRELAVIKQEQETFRNEMSSLQKGLNNVQTGQTEIAKTQKEMEVTMLKEGQANRELVQDTKNITKTLLDHVLHKDKSEAETNDHIRTMKWDIVGKLTLAIFGTGGVFVVIFQLLTR